MEEIRLGLEFQSALPRRERLERSEMVELCHYFNPRSREGSDGYSSGWNSGMEISIRAPAKGATKPVEAVPVDVSLFQSALPRRERREHPLEMYQL